METLTISALAEKHNREKPAIIVTSEQGGILRKVSFQAMADIASEIKPLISSNIPENNHCIGLLMDKNVLIPSIIACLQDLGLCFAFLLPDTLEESCRKLQIKWLLASDCEPSKCHFSFMQTFALSTGDALQLWTYKGFSGQGKSYEGVFCAMQTSGSTGEGKIVRVPYACIEKNVVSLNQHFRVTPADIIYWGTALTFDPSLVELLLALTYGAALQIVPKSVHLNPWLLDRALFQEPAITFLQVVPSVFLRFSTQQMCDILLNSPLKTLAFGGEPFPTQLLAFQRKPGLKVYNLYGVTELSCWATIADLTSHGASLEAPLGGCLDETFVELRSQRGDLVAEGVGEICIGSDSRYCLLDNSPVGSSVRTGDLGEVLDGKLYFRGRKSRSIKRFGHRVVLQTIEDVIFRNTQLRNRLVYSTVHQKLLAFVVIAEPMNEATKTRALDKLRVKLLNVLEEPSFPDFLGILTHLPLNRHGKISDRLLENLYNPADKGHFCSSNVGDVFIELLDRHLKVDLKNGLHLYQHKTLAQLGAGSMLIMQFVQAFEKHVGEARTDEFLAQLLNESLHVCHQFVVRTMRLLTDLGTSKAEITRPIEALWYSDCVQWSYDMKGCVDAPPLAFTSRHGSYIVCGSFAQKLAILNETGGEQFCTVLPGAIEAQPAISQCLNLLFCPCSGAMYCVDIRRKEIAWHYQTSDKTSPACLWGAFLAFGSYNGTCYCLSLKGALVWTAELFGQVKSRPVRDADLERIHVATTRGWCYALDEHMGAQLWSCKVEGPVFGEGCVLGDCTVWPAVIGKIYCIDSKGCVKWTLKAGGHIFSSLKLNDNSIYFGCHDSYLYKISPDAPQMEKFARLDGQIASSPFLHVVAGKLFVVSMCNGGSLHVIDGASRAALFKMQLPAPSFSSPCVLNDRVYVGCRDDRLYCISLTKALDENVFCLETNESY